MDKYYCDECRKKNPDLQISYKKEREPSIESVKEKESKRKSATPRPTVKVKEEKDESMEVDQQEVKPEIKKGIFSAF